jgi:Flp pilus assembly protein TadB
VSGVAAAGPLLGVLLGVIGGGALVLFLVALRGLPARPADRPPSWIERQARGIVGMRGVAAIVAGVVVLLATRWVVGGIGIFLLVFSWRSLGGAVGERKAMARLEALATWTESLRDTIAGAVGLEQAIPASSRVAAPLLQEPLAQLVNRLHTRVPMPEALHRFADDLDDPGADLIVAALIINARLRGPGLRDLLGALAGSAREELDLRRKVNAERRSTRRSAQIVTGISVGLALLLALFNPGYVQGYKTVVGQLVLVIVVGLYAAGFVWMRRLATFKQADRLLRGAGSPVGPPGHAVPGPAADLTASPASAAGVRP